MVRTHLRVNEKLAAWPRRRVEQALAAMLAPTGNASTLVASCARLRDLAAAYGDFELAHAAETEREHLMNHAGDKRDSDPVRARMSQTRLSATPMSSLEPLVSSVLTVVSSVPAARRAWVRRILTSIGMEFCARGDDLMVEAPATPSQQQVFGELVAHAEVRREKFLNSKSEQARLEHTRVGFGF